MTYSTTIPRAHDGGWFLVLERNELIHVETVGGSRNHIHTQVNEVQSDFQREGFQTAALYCPPVAILILVPFSEEQLVCIFVGTSFEKFNMAFLIEKSSEI
jgi:hypothetical protein